MQELPGVWVPQLDDVAVAHQHPVPPPLLQHVLSDLSHRVVFYHLVCLRRTKKGQAEQSERGASLDGMHSSSGGLEETAPKKNIKNIAQSKAQKAI